MGKSNDLLHCIIEAILDKKGKEIVNIDLKQLDYAMCDNFVVCHGDSTTQVNAIAEAIEDKVRELMGIRVTHREGKENAQWVLLDYGIAVIHIFIKNARDYYQLEDLWGDAEITLIKDE